jgi:NADH-quinone oxidoreductase subunit B
MNELQNINGDGKISPTTAEDKERAVFPGAVHPTAGGGIVLSKLDEVINWARSNSLWPLVFGTSCCAIEMMSTASAKYDWSRFGFEVARATPRQADLIIIAGTIVNKMAPVLKRLYDQMADPKYVIAMGACATSGGPFFYNTYSVVKGADHCDTGGRLYRRMSSAPGGIVTCNDHATGKNQERRNERTDKEFRNWELGIRN